MITTMTKMFKNHKWRRRFGGKRRTSINVDANKRRQIQRKIYRNVLSFFELHDEYFKRLDPDSFWCTFLPIHIFFCVTSCGWLLSCLLVAWHSGILLHKIHIVSILLLNLQLSAPAVSILHLVARILHT